jgi:hypothetical protein
MNGGDDGTRLPRRCKSLNWNDLFAIDANSGFSIIYAPFGRPRQAAWFSLLTDDERKMIRNILEDCQGPPESFKIAQETSRCGLGSGLEKITFQPEDVSQHCIFVCKAGFCPD